ncbi:hypothetical protein MMC11_002800 [Xylographa trunciseda]|nr:hypothetical protein [Xylographa trunciseda]
MARRLPRVTSGTQERGVYANIVKIAETSPFWADAWPLLETEGLGLGPMIPVLYVGSAAQEKIGFEKRVHRQHESADYRRNHPGFHYKAWNASTGHDFVRIGKAAPKDPVALLRVVEATAVACLHTYVNADYTQLLHHFGIVESGSQGFGLNRTSKGDEVKIVFWWGWQSEVDREKFDAGLSSYEDVLGKRALQLDRGVVARAIGIVPATLAGPGSGALHGGREASMYGLGL